MTKVIWWGVREEQKRKVIGYVLSDANVLISESKTGRGVGVV